MASTNFHKVLRALNTLAPSLMAKPTHTVPAKISKSTRLGKNLRYETFEFYDELQIIFGEGVATGKNAMGIGDSTDARTCRVGGYPKEDEAHDIDDIYELDGTTHHYESPELSVDDHTIPGHRKEKFKPKKRPRSEKGTSQKEENPVMAINNQILNLIQQREERQQKEAERKKNNVSDVMKEIVDLD